MRREDFVFTIGYQGDTAIVDGHARSRYGRLSARQLAEQGFLKPALSSALYSQNPEELEEVVRLFNEKSGTDPVTLEQLKRVLGVFEVPQMINKVKVI